MSDAYKTLLAEAKERSEATCRPHFIISILGGKQFVTDLNELQLSRADQLYHAYYPNRWHYYPRRASV